VRDAGLQVSYSSVSFSACVLTYVLKGYSLIGLSVYSLMASLFVGGIYSVLPDIDMPSSVIRRVVERGALLSVFFLIIGYVFYPVVFLLYAAVAVVFLLLLLWYLKHRGFFHTVFAGLLLSIPWAFLDPVVSVLCIDRLYGASAGGWEVFSLF